MSILARLAGVVLVTLLVISVGRAAETVIVYDASNSMWGQIEGKAKVTIARKVMADIIRDWDEETPLGLVAYGHRREGDCTDIETVVPVGPVDREALIARVESLQPKGKTPLTDAVRHAAEELKYRDAPATVVLVSDGIESCDADPCAVSKELAQSGINFTAHVIGFDVGDVDQSQLQCIAENTGGRFFAARDAEGLKSALGEATRMAAEPVPGAEVTITAPGTAVAGSAVEVSWSGEKIQDRDFVTTVAADAKPGAYNKYERVDGKSTTTLIAPGEAGPHEIRYISSATGEAVARTPIKLTEPNATVSAPDTVTGGADFTVRWENAVHPKDYVTIVAADSKASAYGDYVYVEKGSQGTLSAPGEPGAYEVRYLLHSSGEAIASTPIRVGKQSVSVSAPDQVTAGAEFTVGWNNTVHPRDYVTIVPADAPAKKYGDYVYVEEREQGTLKAPGKAGAYEVRYLLNESGKSVAATPVTVVEPDTTVSGPERVTAGAEVTVQWTSPVHPRDYVTIVSADAPESEYNDYVYVEEKTQATLTAPAEPGPHKIRYLLSKDGKKMASAPIRLTAPKVSLSVPEEVTAESGFTVSWVNAVHPRDYVTVVAAGAPARNYGDYAYIEGRSEAKLTAPAEPGEYEVRYVLDASGEAIVSRPVKVVKE